MKINKPMIWLCGVIIFAFIIAGTVLTFSNQAGGTDEREEVQVPQERKLPGEEFITRHMRNEAGLLKTNLKQHISQNNEIAEGEEALSESLGMWMIYCVKKGDQKLFDQSLQKLQHFLKDGWIAWKIGSEKPAVSTNASIDDLRVVEALYLAADKWGDQRYTETAQKIGASLENNQIVDGLLGDFYDVRAKWASPVMTLSYLNTVALKRLANDNAVEHAVYAQHEQFLKAIPLKNGFFPFSYNIQTKQYEYRQEVNLIDQLYILYHRAKEGHPSPEVWNFLKEQFYAHGLLYGRYDAVAKTPSVRFESPAVYGLAILAAVELQEHTFAQDLYFRMNRMQTRNPGSVWYGGYINYNTMDTHIFDNLVPLVAERELYNEGLLH